jgi:hypothetical protein
MIAPPFPTLYNESPVFVALDVKMLSSIRLKNKHDLCYNEAKKEVFYFEKNSDID